MSMKDRLLKKSGDLTISSKVSESGKVPPRTAPGQMLAFRGQMLETNKKVEELQERLKEFEGGSPTCFLNPEKIYPAKWANRSEWSFLDGAFEELKEAIRVSGGNVQPIKVRPRPGTDSEYEIVFGRRRHRACKDLGLPVLAMVDSSVSDLQLFMQMDQENRQRKDLSPWEQGLMYQMALAEGLWKSQRQMAEGLGITQALISSALLVALLPQEIVNAFPSPNDIQFRWARNLHKQLKFNRAGLLARARAVTTLPDRTARQVVTLLLKTESGKGTEIQSKSINLTQKKSGLHIDCPGQSLNDTQRKALRKVIEEFFAGQA